MNEEFKQRVYAWLGSTVNRNWDLDGYPPAQPYQCYDLVNKFSLDIVGAGRFVGLYASDIINQPGTKYRKILNTASFVPQPGDIAVWNRNLGGGAGHTGVCTGEGDTNYFVSLDQNWSRPTATYVRHDYNNFIGVLRPLASETATPAEAIPTPTADNEGIVNGSGLRGRTAPNTGASSPWYFNHLDRVLIHFRTRGENITSGPYAPSDWWYLVTDKSVATSPQVWVSDAYIRTTKNPAAVPDYTTTPPPLPTPTQYTFAKDVACVTEVIPAGIGNFESGNFPQNQDTAVIHDFGTKETDTITSVINTFKSVGGRGVSAHFAVSGKRIIQFVSLKDRAYHAGSQGNGYIGIETDPAQDVDTIESTKELLRQLRTKYGRTLRLIEHNTLMATACGDDVNLANYDITEAPPILPNPPADPTITDRLNALQLLVKQITDFLDRVFLGWRQ